MCLWPLLVLSYPSSTGQIGVSDVSRSVLFIFLLRTNDGIFIHTNGSEVFRKFHSAWSPLSLSPGTGMPVLIFFNFELVYRYTSVDRKGRAKIGRRCLRLFNEIPVDIQFTQTRIPKALRDVVVIERNLAFFHFHIARVHWRRIHLTKSFMGADYKETSTLYIRKYKTW